MISLRYDRSNQSILIDFKTRMESWQETEKKQTTQSIFLII